MDSLPPEEFLAILFLLSHQPHPAKTHFCTMGLMGASGCHFFWEAFPRMKACGETFTMWELLATFGEKQPGMINTSFVLETHTVKPQSLQLPGCRTVGKFCSGAAALCI